MNDNNEATTTAPKIQFTEQNAADLMKILLERGYFHDDDNNQATVAAPPPPQSLLSDLTSSQQQLTTYDIHNSNVIPTKFGTYVTVDRLKEKLHSKIKELGRLNIDDNAAVALFGVPADSIRRCLCDISSTDVITTTSTTKDTTNNNQFLRVKDEILSYRYIDETIINNQIVAMLQEEGKLLVADIARDVMKLPLETTLSILHERLLPTTTKIQLRTNQHGAKVLVTTSYLDQMKSNVKDAIVALKQPIQIQQFACDKNWEPDWVYEFLLEFKSSDLPGELHGNDSYVPTCYIEKQKKEVVNYYTSNGYLTSEQSHSFGVLMSQMICYVKNACGSQACLVLNNDSVVVHPDILVSSLEAAIQEAVSTNSWIDLQPHIPQELLSSPHVDDVRTLIIDHVLPNLVIVDDIDDVVGEETKKKKKDDGDDGGRGSSSSATATTVSVGAVSLDSENAIFMSRSMIEEISKTHLPPLIDSFAKIKAKELDNSGAASAAAGSTTGISTSNKRPSATAKFLSTKDKRKAKKAAKSKQLGQKAQQQQVDGGGDHDYVPIVPLNEVVEAVVAAYPELSELNVHESSNENGGVFHSLCRQAFYTDDFRTRCDTAVHEELKRLEKERAEKVKLVSSANKKGSSESAVVVKNVQVSFEDPNCFAASCYLIQGMAAFLEYAAAATTASSSDKGDDDNGNDAKKEDKEEEEDAKFFQEDVLAELQRDFSIGCCADFTRRITQYSLYKNNDDDTVFLFEKKTATEDDDDKEFDMLPHYCLPVSIATRRYPPIFLSCHQDDGVDDGGDGDGDSNEKKKGPLPMLRDMLPVTVGTALARQWILLGGECYEGGYKPGDLDGFLKHAEENALTICGLPFKKLDKKAKKQFLNSRRQLLLQMLEEETNPGAVLDLCVMLLFQLVKNHVVFGSYLRGPILRLLATERKISTEVSAELLSMAERLESGSEIDPEHVRRVKDCALGKSSNKPK